MKVESLRKKLKGTLRQVVDIKQYGLLVILILFCLIVGSLEPSFFLPQNLLSILEGATIVALISLAMTIVISGGSIDLSIAHIAGFAGILASVLMAWYHFSLLTAFIIALVSGVGFGVINGMLVGFLGINSFIATLGMQFVIIGVRFLITKGGQSIFMLPRTFIHLGTGDFFAIPLLLIFLLILFGSAYILMNRTAMGRKMYMMGSNLQASFLSGVSVRLLTLLTFTFAAFYASFGGILLAARSESANVTLAQGYLIDAFVVPLLGSAMFKGRATIVGTLTAAILLSALFNGFSLLNVSPSWRYVTKGVLLVVAILLMGTQRSA